MSGEQLTDLDELVLRCKDKQSRLYIAESVACYRAGAFRSCIVAAWIAVVFDFVHKLRELELAGDGQAKVKLQEFETARRTKDVTLSQLFEATVLEVARDDFELLSPLEFDALERLHKDRHLCAHPSMQSLEEHFQPLPELARYHIHNSVTCLLQHPPVQGRTAHDRIWTDIKSAGFPRNTQDAIRYFKSGPLPRARENLVRDLVVGLTKDLLKESRPALERERQFAALTAILAIFFNLGEQTLQQKLSNIVRAVDDIVFDNVFEYLRRIPLSASYLEEHARIKIENYLRNVDPKLATAIVADALQIQHLTDIARSRVGELPVESLLAHSEMESIPDFVHAVVAHYAKSSSFAEANTNRQYLSMVMPLLSKDQMHFLLKSYCNNSQIQGSRGGNSLIISLFDATADNVLATKPEWKQFYTEYQHNSQLKALQLRVVERYPEIPDEVNVERDISNEDCDDPFIDSPVKPAE